MGSDSYLKCEVPHSGAACHNALLYDVSSREVFTPPGTVLYHTSCYDLHQGGDEHLIHYLRRRRGGGGGGGVGGGVGGNNLCHEQSIYYRAEGDGHGMQARDMNVMLNEVIAFSTV